MWKAPRKMQRVEIARVRQHLAHALGRPGLDLGADPAQPLDLVRDGLVIVGLRDVQPAGQPDRRRACRSPRSCGARSRRPAPTAPRAALAWSRPMRSTMSSTSSAEARQHEAGVAAGRRPGDALGLQHRHRPAAPRDLARDRQARKPCADRRRRRRRDRNSGAGARGLATRVASYQLVRCCSHYRSLLLSAVAARMLDCRGFEIDAARVL